MEEENLVKEFSQTGPKPFLKEVLLPAGIILMIILVGGLTGWFLGGRKGGLSLPAQTKPLTGGAEFVQGSKEVGIKDTRVFRDTTEGKIEINDNKDITEGSHKLLRPGGQNQTAYLTSSVVDLNQFLGKCVQVWGETFAAQKASWLMDVGSLRIIDKCPEGL